ncbi:hypothetical protein ACH5RR_021772 [Cinchona calisaya]|uniref:TF-B3 domain-containing protein n=1 Tax=Cinchona calisaya TaxID=153742 RepID=A0ABD2ZN82_9GENT
MAVLSFRRRPRKSSHPCRAWTNSIQDLFRYSPSIEKNVPFKKSRETTKGKRSMARVARSNVIRFSLPSLLDDHMHNDQEEPFLKEKLAFKKPCEVKTNGQTKKIKITLKKRKVDDDDDDGVMELQQKEEENSTNNNVCPPQEQQQLPLEFKNYIKELGATGDPVLVIQKRLFPSDVESGLQRLLIPLKKVANHGFLTEEERSRFNRHNKHQEINAILIGTSIAHQFTIKLKKWYMGKTETYALMSGWKEVVRRNGLKPGQLVQLWSFKKASQLFFVLVRL